MDVAFTSIVFDVYLQINDVIKEINIPYLKKVQTCIKNIFCLNNDWNVIISKAEKDMICGKTFIHFLYILSKMHITLLQENS